MANSSRNTSNATNEKLYRDSHLKLLHLKKNGNIESAVEPIRELFLLSNAHCSEQNMTALGAKKYKSELYAEYCNIVDSKEPENLLPIIKSNSRTKILPVQNQLMKNSLATFANFLHSVNGLDINDKTQNCVNRNQTRSNNKSGPTRQIMEPRLHSAQVIPKSFVKSLHGVSYQAPQVQRNNSNNFSSNSEENSRTDIKKNFEYPNGFARRLPSKNKYEQHTQSHSSTNKKICVQSKPEPKTMDVGFISASTMYRNPLKKKTDSTMSNPNKRSEEKESSEATTNEAFKNFDKKIVDIVLNEIMDFSPNIRWSDIAGLEFVKTTVQEIVIWPLLRPDIFTGLRAPPRGILLFGPPGTGKTLIGKCIATESNSTFFCISASSLASKWVGESEQMVRVLFAAARLNQPSVIFIDEIDSLLSQRSDKDQDFTRKLKTEFLVQFDGAKTNSEERVLVVGATNRPHELDEAARRRFVKRLFVPLPDEPARRQIIKKLLDTHHNSLSEDDLQKVCDETAGYSGSDVTHLCKEAAMGPIRCIGPENIKTVSLDQVGPIALCDFTDALRQVRASVVADDLNYYMEWNKKFGSFGIPS